MVTDIKVFVEGLQANTTLKEPDFSRNDISDKLGLAKGLWSPLRLVYRPALLQGVTVIKVFVEGLQANTTLTELDFSRNDISDKLGLAKGLAG